MASEGEACCESDPNFAVICAFLEKFGPTCGISNVDFLLLQGMLENTHEVSPELIDLHIKLLRKARKSVSNERWERAVIKICHTICSQDAWEMERFGYKKARLSAKIRILKELLEMQFDFNPKFKTEINKMTAEELRSQPIGRDKMGHAYWFQCDENCQIRIYKEDPDEETWTLVAKDREGLVGLISQLNAGDTVKLDLEPVVNEDSNSTELEKPIVDTGQVIDSDSKKEETDSSNDAEIKNENNCGVKKSADEDSSNETESKNDEDELGSPEQKEEIVGDTKPDEPIQEEDNLESALNLSQKKPMLRIKSITELMSQPTLTENPSKGELAEGTSRIPPVHLYSNPVLPRKTESDFKRFSEDDLAENLKKPRLNRPVLLTSKKSPYGNEEQSLSGEDEVGEAIEEPVMYVYGEGNGRDCETGNEKPNKSDCDKTDCSQGIHTAGALNDKSDVENSISSESSLSVSDKSERSKPPFKTGTIIDVRSEGGTFTKSGSPTKKSRWDIGKPLEIDGKSEPEIPLKTEDVIKKPMFFFGPGCLQFKLTTTVNTDENSDKTSSATDEVHENEKTENHNTIGEPEKLTETENIKEIEKQVIDDEEVGKEATLPCVVVELPDSSVENKKEEVQEDAIVKKTAYECGNNNKEKSSGDVDDSTKQNAAETAFENSSTYLTTLHNSSDADLVKPDNEVTEILECTKKPENLEAANPSSDLKCDTNKKKDSSVGKSLANIIDRMNTANATKLQQCGVKENVISIGNTSVQMGNNKSRVLEVPKAGEIDNEKQEILVEKIVENSSDAGANCLKETEDNLKEELLDTVNEEANLLPDKSDLSQLSEKPIEVCPAEKSPSPLPNAQVLDNKIDGEESKLPDTVISEDSVSAEQENAKDTVLESTENNINNQITETNKEKSTEELADQSENQDAETAVITCVDINDLIKKQSPLPDDDSNSVNPVVDDKDPLACTDEDSQKNTSAPLTLSSFTLDYDGESGAPVEIPKVTRKRNRLSTESKPDDEVAEKRQKLRGKRTVDAELRRSIESQKSQVISSSEDDSVGAQDTQVLEGADDEEEPQKTTQKLLKRGRGRRKKKWFAKKGRVSPVPSSDVTSETSRAESVGTPPVKKTGGPRKRKTTLLGLDIPEGSELIQEPITGVRQSRRIAQLKIKEEAERRKIEETVLNEITAEHKKKKSKKYEDKDYKVDTKRKGNEISDEDSTIDADIDDKKKKRKRKHKNFRKLFDGSNPWLERSDTSSSNEIEEEEEEDMIDYTEEEPKSDHEFSPESDLEDTGDVQPLKRARTAKKESDVDEVDDCACQKCGKKDHPEWILLCDGCDNGWHCSCLRPALLVIPEGDWFCPPCQHVKLIQNLQTQLNEYDKKLSKKNIEDRRKERLAYVGISLNNVLPAKETEQNKIRRTVKQQHSESGEEEEDEDDESGESECSETESSADSDDEPIYRLRERRQAHSYRFNDYDELINSAIQDEMEAVKGAGNQGRGKDIATIVNAEKEEEAHKTKLQDDAESLPPVVPKNIEINTNREQSEEEEEEEIRPVKKLIGRKKPRKLNSLDISSGDDHYSDEDFKGTTSTEDEDEEDLDDILTDSSDGSRYGRRNGPVRRSTRARIARYDREFINDDSEDDEAPRRKKTRSIWDESETEESDGSWGSRRRRKKKASGGTRSRQSSTKRKRSKKKKKRNDDSDSDAFKRKRKPKVKYGRIGSDNEDLGIRTRGKKINYLDVLGSDSDDDVPKKATSKVLESEEEYVVNEEDVLDEERDEFENDKETSEEEESEDDEDEEKSSKKAKDLNNSTSAVATSVLDLAKITQESLNPIEEINKNIEEMSEKDMEKLMEEESYANKQLALVALQIEKEKRRKEQEAKNLEVLLQHSQKSGINKRGRRDPSELPVDLVMDDYQNNAELSEPPGVALPMFGDLPPINSSPEEAPKKRKGRGKGKKTLAAEAAKQAAAAESPPSSVAPLSNATSSPIHNAKLSVAAPPQPFSQSQPAPSVITRMLQSQPYPVSTSGTYYPSEPHHPDMVQAGGAQFIQGTNPRIPVSSPFRQGPPPPPPPPQQQSHGMGHYQIRPGVPPLPQAQQQQQIRNPNQTHPPHLYQHSHRPMDPSPSGGGPITMNQERNSPALIPPPADSPLSNKSESTPPPPPYSRPSMMRFPPSSNGNPMGVAAAGGGGSLPPPPPPPRHVQMLQGHVAPPPRPNTMSPYPPPNIPPNYYGAYGPPPPLVGSEEALPPPAAYQTPPYPDHYGTDGPGLSVSENSNSKGFDDESGGEFGGLVSYFSSQREDDLDT